MGFNEFVEKLFGNKATRDMKEIKPWVDKIKAVYPSISQLSNDELRARTVELKARIQAPVAETKQKIAELKAKVETLEIEEREPVFNQIDKLEKEVLEIYEKALDEALPEAFASLFRSSAGRVCPQAPAKEQPSGASLRHRLPSPR